MMSFNKLAVLAILLSVATIAYCSQDKYYRAVVEVRYFIFYILSRKKKCSSEKEFLYIDFLFLFVDFRAARAVS